jgi:hypothetical protein
LQEREYRTNFPPRRVCCLPRVSLGDTGAVLKNPRVWIYLLVGVVSAGLIAYSQWHDSDAKRLERCVEASVSEMLESNPELARFDNAGPIFADASRAACKRHLGIT